MQRFKVKSSIRLRYLHCQAKKPTPIEQDNSEPEKESPPAKRQRINDLTPASDPSTVTFKKCSIVIRRVAYIEKAIEKGYSSFTRINKNGIRLRTWLKRN